MLFASATFLSSCVVAPPEEVRERQRARRFQSPATPGPSQVNLQRQQELEQNLSYDEDGLEYDYYFIHTEEGSELKRKLKSGYY